MATITGRAGMISFGEKLLRDFPASRWKSYIHLTLARAYAAKLMLTYPDIDLNGANRPTDPEALRRAAIAHFRAFLEGEPGVARGRLGLAGSVAATCRTSTVANPFRLHRLKRRFVIPTLRLIGPIVNIAPLTRRAAKPGLLLGLPKRKLISIFITNT